jgi:putative ribosome biogenesis GTPase RsgA
MCKYKKCSHTIEPDCAVLEAFEIWAIDPYRYAFYHSLYNQIK